MKKLFSTQLVLLIGLNVIYSVGFSQTIIDYQTWTGASGCNIFASPTSVPATINGTNGTITHITTIGQPVFNSLNKSVDLESKIVNVSQYQGTEYLLLVDFKQYYSYKITFNAALIKPQQTEPNALLRIDLNNGANGWNTLCNGTEIINPNGSGNLKQSQQIADIVFNDYVFNYYSLLSFESNLLIAAIPQAGTSTQKILIRKITIEETPPPVTFTLPTSTIFECGNTTPQTFTVTNVYGTTGITDYT